MTRLLRPLGQIETAMASLHELAGTTQTASLVSLSGPLDVPLLRSAAALLQRRHPLLRACIVEREGRLHYQETSPSVLVQELELFAAADMLGALEQELNAPLDARKALWKLALFQEQDGTQCHLALTCHHAIVDAVSLTLLLGELLGYCDALLAGEAPEVVEEPCAPALDAFLVPGGQPQATSQVESPAYFQVARLAERHTGLHTLELPPTLLRQLHATARGAGLSLNAVLGAALAQAASSVGLGEAIRLNSAVSLRQRAAQPISAQLLGCFIGVAGCDLQVAGRSLAVVARDYQDRLQQLLTNADQASPPPDLPQLRQRAAQLSQAQRFVQGIALTNHGRIVLPECRAFQLHGYLNVACRNAGNFAVAVHATTYAERLTLSFTFVIPLIERQRIAALSEQLLHSLSRFSHAQEPLCHEN